MTQVTIRRATPADAADVAAMVREIAAHEDQAAQVRVTDERWRALLARPEVIVLLAARERLLIRWGMEADNIDAQRFYRRQGAAPRPKILAAWPPNGYADSAPGH